jgi:hypothetical protein
VAFARRLAMRDSGSGREARRRPELDLMLGPLEAAARSDDTSRDARETKLGAIELDPAVLPTQTEGG